METDTGSSFRSGANVTSRACQMSDWGTVVKTLRTKGTLTDAHKTERCGNLPHLFQDHLN